MGLPDWILLGAVAAALAAAIVFLFRRRGRCGGCGGKCEECKKNLLH